MSVKFVLYGFAFLAVTMASVLAGTANGQVKSIDEIAVRIDDGEHSLLEIFHTIETNSELRFFYYDKKVNLKQKVELNSGEEIVARILGEVSGKTDLQFKQINNTVAVSTKPKTKDKNTSQMDDLKTVTGTVRDDSGEPLPGVTVFVEGASSGTVTDLDGKFSLETPDTGYLIFSFIGFQRERINLEGRAEFNITLRPEDNYLQEVVVTGYGSQIKREVTGNISSVKGEDLAKVQVPSFDAALQGRAAGVQVNQGSGVPGAPSRILIRGTSSISAGSEPLIVVDGFPLTQELTGQGGINSFMAINPADIEDIQILKDAAATAIYGSRGANGVILVTTKSGKEGQSSVNFNYSYGVQEPANMVEMADGGQWLRMVDQSFANDGFDRPWDPVVDGGLVSSFIDTPNQYLTREMVEQVAASGGTDWLSPLWRQGSIEDVNLSATRGNEKSSYFISLRYQDHKGLMNAQRLRTYGVRANLDFSVLDNLKTGIRTNFNYFENQQGQLGGSNEANPNGGRPDRGNRGGYGAALGGAVPVLPVFMADGSYFDPFGGRNPIVANLPSNYHDKAENYRNISSVFVEFSPVDGLSLRAEGSIDTWYTKSTYHVSDAIRISRYGEVGNVLRNNLNLNAYATYRKKLGDHQFTIVAGAERQSRNFFRTDARAENLVSSDINIGETAGNNVISLVTGTFPDFRIQSYFGRLNYNYKEKYYAMASFRRDGASVFGRDNRYGQFPALSAGWIISEEDFASNLGPVNFLKLRASFGRTGNADIPNVLENRYVTWPAYSFGSGIVQSVIGVPDIQWEEINTVDASLDFEAFESRVSGSIGFYQQDVKNMLLLNPIPPSQGILLGSSAIWTNIGDLRNRGAEFSLNTVNIDSPGGFRWRTEVNLTLVKDRVMSLVPRLDENNLGIVQGATITRTGNRLGTYFMAEHAFIDPETGYEYIYEINQDLFNETGIIEKTGETILATPAAAQQNRVELQGKSGLPTYFGGFQNTFSYKGLDLTVFFSFQGGNYLYDDNRVEVAGGSNFRADLEDRMWTPENRNAELPRQSYLKRTRENEPIARPGSTSLYLQDGSFIRLRNVQLSYTLPASLLSRARIKGGRVYVNATNLLTFTDYDGFDPEVANFDSNRQNRNLQQGFIGGAPFPQLRTITGGVSFTF
ncbi:TonB-linked outer membrane protein, SusC/RagA family [Cyclobacterium lianum]|uniref:TonB-linked outer membrane protein, SusC/RagA family n=1 Tax=Cyclobacterium lianum TaxID=388280 RepID=A0A1M7PA88_9BACT|nr:TonB-dependent receptor [Cyclobacterium lianum]SHN13650.1 TonB-linked outer membrane protein, SusC/RagA family [Cyclobacterium lianum]